MLKQFHAFGFPLIILALFAFCGMSRAQSGLTPNASGAIKGDEFGDILASDKIARLDYFSTQLQNFSDARAFLVAYRSHRDLPGLSGKLARQMRQYLINNRGIDAGRIVIIDGGAADCLSQELWIVPVGATPTVRPDAYVREFADPDEAYKYDSGGLNEIAESDLTYYDNIENSVEGYAEVLQRSPKLQAYIIVYGSRRYLNTGNLRALNTSTRRLRAQLIKSGVKPARIKLLNGGYRQWSSAELWIVPRGAHAPIATPTVFPRRTRRR